MDGYEYELLKQRLEERRARARLRALAQQGPHDRSVAPTPFSPTIHFWRKDSS